MEGWWPTLLGAVAGLCTSFSFVPQVQKAWQGTDTAAISKRMYVISLAAFGLWIVHGIMIGSVPIILFNAVNIVCSGLILALKLRGARAAKAAPDRVAS
jgi:MtN3 and saliva related transmembrane protein